MAFHALRGTRRVLLRARAPVKHSGAPMSFWLWWLLMGADACTLIAVVILVERQKHDE